MNDAREYKEVLRRFRTSRNSNPIPNRYPWQCIVAIEELTLLGVDIVRSGEQCTIRILSECFPWQVYGSPGIRDGLVSFLEAGGIVRLLIWNDSIDGHRRKLIESFQSIALDSQKFQWRLSETRDDSDRLNHMFVVDESAYRFEAPHKSLEGAKFSPLSPIVPARVCFNDPIVAKVLVANFDTLWTQVGEEVLQGDHQSVVMH